MLREDQKENREQEVIELTSKMLHWHYCENNINALIAQLDDELIWLGVAEQEFASGTETVTGIFRQFTGQVPKCVISGEEYEVLTLAPDAYLCSGRLWVATDASTKISLRVHQRVTFAFRLREGRLRCCHIHISNPYSEMVEDDIGFPLKMAQQTYQYLQEQIAAQKKQIVKQTELLERMSYEDSLTGLYNRNKYNEMVASDQHMHRTQLGIVCMDLNGLKRVNDQLGHSAGDILIRSAADQIRRIFDGEAYRIGGDEFVVIDDTLTKEAFYDAVHALIKGMEEHQVSCSVGVSWRAEHCGIAAQLEEADRSMYAHKKEYYRSLRSGWEA